MVSAGITLALDAAASVGTVAVLRDGALVAACTVEMRSDGEERYFPTILETLTQAGTSTRGIDRVVCGVGPGSFTSLRVAGALAKGIAHGSSRPLFGVPSLALIVAASEDTLAPGSRWLATLDAMRGDRYAALVAVGPQGALTRVEPLGLLSADALAERAAGLRAQLIGPDEALVAMPHASGLVRCLGLLEAVAESDLASWEPVYGRLAEAQVKWEAAHGRSLDAGRSSA